ncbi:MAG TPA: dTDP-4-dehydrorhamnose reductase [Steroidobacteraceae bacterium]|nr:dTDP-4-dehydrorhamnose reductase [Steroidobacteraceae bacterium]
MRVLVTGAAGQLGRALLRSAPPQFQVTGCSRQQLDIADAALIERLFASTLPQAVINAAAYTNVEAAESHRNEAYRANAEGVDRLAQACARHGARLVHVSTDFVFDGRKSTPYLPEDVPEPLSVYGASKLEGEHRAQAALGERACIVRSSWLYGEGSSCFVTRMLQLMRGNVAVRVVLDQVGAPTWSRSLAGALWKVVELGLGGIHHWCDSGLASRYDFAVAIAEEALAVQRLQAPPEIIPISSAQYPTRARRPAYAVLDKSSTEAACGARALHWRASLRAMLQSMVPE